MFYKIAMVKGIAKASRSGGDGGSDIVDAIFSVIIVLVIGALVAAIIVASPIVVIVDGARLIGSGKDPSGIGAIGAVISNIWVTVEISLYLYYKYMPMADSRKYYEELSSMKPMRIAVVIGTIIWSLAIIGLLVGIVLSLNNNLASAGPLIIIWGAITLITNVIAGVTHALD